MGGVERFSLERKSGVGGRLKELFGKRRSLIGQVRLCADDRNGAAETALPRCGGKLDAVFAAHDNGAFKDVLRWRKGACGASARWGGKCHS